MDVFWIKPFTPRSYQSQAIGELIHADIKGPRLVKSLRSAKYYVFFKDDYSKYSRVFFIKPKNGVSKHLCTFLKEVLSAGHRVKMF